MQLILSLYILFSAASFAQVVMCKGISDSREVTVEVGESNLSRAMVEVVVHTDGEKFKGQGVQTYNENDTSSISAFLKADQEYQSVELLVDMTIRENDEGMYAILGFPGTPGSEMIDLYCVELD